MQDFTYSPQSGHGEPLPRRKSNAIWWLLGGVVGVVVLGCGGIMAFLVYVSLNGPETSVYTGNRIPSQFTRTMKDAGALEEDEKILYFYSDAMTDILDGFYFVSDRRVVIYSQLTGESPLTSIPFDIIADLDLYRNDSFIEDGQITLSLEDGRVLSFPVSSEFERDQDFFDAIRDRVPKKADDW